VILSVICHTCALADKGYTVIISGVFLLGLRDGKISGASGGSALDPLGALQRPQLFWAMTLGHFDSQGSQSNARN